MCISGIGSQDDTICITGLESRLALVVSFGRKAPIAGLAAIGRWSVMALAHAYDVVTGAAIIGRPSCLGSTKRRRTCHFVGTTVSIAASRLPSMGHFASRFPTSQGGGKDG